MDLFHVLQSTTEALIGIHGPDLLGPVVLNLGLENTVRTVLTGGMIDHGTERKIGNGIAGDALLCPKPRSRLQVDAGKRLIPHLLNRPFFLPDETELSISQ
jgi:hypothetical protein